MDQNTTDLWEAVLGLQAEVSAFKDLMFKANPDLAKEHQKLAESHRKIFLRAWTKRQQPPTIA